MDMTAKIYTDETAAREHLEKLLWPNGPVCPHCSSLDAATKLKGKSTRPGVYWCNACEKPYTVTVGTVYERSHIPLHKWLLATELLTASKKGISSHQLMRMLGLGSYRTAWFMSMRIREGMAPEADAGRMGGAGQVVEADETELSPSRKSRPRPRIKNLKFVSLVERGGKVRSRKLTGAEGPVGMQVHKVLYRNLHPESVLHTDGAPHYTLALAAASHEAVNHNKEFARTAEDGSRVHTNSAEGFFSIFKRGLVGTYQHMSEQHLHRYLAECQRRRDYAAVGRSKSAARTQARRPPISGAFWLFAFHS
jgi:transposase-like protein